MVILPGEIQQHFSLPKSIIKYIAMHPSNAEVYKKLICTCKYFYNQNPILVLNNQLCYMESEEGSGVFEWKVAFKKNDINIDMDIIPCKLWVTNSIFVNNSDGMNKSAIASIIPKIYRCDASDIVIFNQDLTFDEFLLLGSNATKFDLNSIRIIENNDGEKEEVMLEKVIEKLPKIQKIIWFFNIPDCKCISINTVAELMKIEHFGNITSLEFAWLPEIFDAKAFFEAIKMKYKNMKVLLNYATKEHGFSDQFKQKIDEIVEEIISTQNFTYKPPLILCVFENDSNKFRKMIEIYESYKNTQF